jgi:glycosyltransferase involved in cell wall biosynthesis
MADITKIASTQDFNELPNCQYLHDGVCEHVNNKASTRMCTICKIIGPFCGKEISSKNLDTFKKVINKMGVRPHKDIVMNAVMSKANLNWKENKPIWLKATNFLTAVKSRGIIATALNAAHINNEMGDKVDAATYATRQLSCFGNEYTPSCHLLTINNKGKFCKACGCGTNPLARLDKDEEVKYTKLHYPALTCPLKRPGFSNHSPSELSVIIPVLNDNEEVNETISSIRASSPGDVEIIVIDDNSDIPVQLKDKSVKLIRNEKRLGAGMSRHNGILVSKGKYLLILDAHMRFVPGWYEAAMERLIKDSKIVWCAACLGLDKDNMNIEKPAGTYLGANLILKDQDKIFEGEWATNKPDQDDYEVSCVMGASYFIHKEWYMRLKGLEHSRMYGSEEPMISLKILLAGGEIRVAKQIKIGHKFRSTSPFSYYPTHHQYNKLRAMKVLLPANVYEVILKGIPKNSHVIAALKMLEDEKAEIDKDIDYYKSIFIRDLDWLCDKFNIKHPLK